MLHNSHGLIKDSRKDKSILNQYIHLLYIIGLILNFNGAIAGNNGIYLFDAGSAGKALEPDAVLLTKDDLLKPGDEYGLLEPAKSEFFRKDLFRSRSNLTIDGITGKSLAFKLMLPEGDWRITVWIDGGLEDSSTVLFEINQNTINPGWQAFKPPSEGRTDLMNVYRLYQGRFNTGTNGLELRIHSQQDSVRLLGLSINPEPVVIKERHSDLIRKFKCLGQYGADESLLAIREELHQLAQKDENDYFVVYWLQQIDLLIRAEELKNLMGWEWAKHKTGLSIFGRFNQAVMLFDGLLNQPEPEEFYFYERALWNRARLLYWLGQERHGKNEFAGADRDLSQLYEQYPEDDLLAMYNGKKIAAEGACNQIRYSSSAPEWSKKQREALCRLREIAYWWVNERQAENGEFGGKLGDDVELLRWWVPLILAGDTTAYRGWKLLADEVWRNPQVYKGFAKHASDVEHASEFISDTAPLMAMFSDDPLYLDRLRPSAEYFENLWTGLSDKGNRLFKSSWFSSTEVNTDPPKNRDVEYNTRATKAVRYLAWRENNPTIVKLLHDHSRTWLKAALRVDKNKPTGIIPPSIRFPDEAINGDEPTWYKANMYWKYFDWNAHAGGMMMDQLLFTYTLTGDKTLLKPITSALELVEKHKDQASLENNIPGSPEWTAAILLSKKSLWDVVSQWRLLTGETKFDSILKKFGSPYLKYRITGEEDFLVEGLDKLLESVRYNLPLLTSEVLHTDRVYVKNADHLKAMLTGDGVPESMSPFYAVSWENTDDDFTALVRKTATDYLNLSIYSHSAEIQQITMRLWNLDHGEYRLKIVTENDSSTTFFSYENKGQRLILNVNPDTLVEVEIKRK